MQKTRKKPMQMEILTQNGHSVVTIWGASSVDHFTSTLVLVRIGRGTVRLMGSELSIRAFEGHILEVRGNVMEMGLLGNAQI